MNLDQKRNDAMFEFPFEGRHHRVFSPTDGPTSIRFQRRTENDQWSDVEPSQELRRAAVSAIHGLRMCLAHQGPSLMLDEPDEAGIDRYAIDLFFLLALHSQSMRVALLTRLGDYLCVHCGDFQPAPDGMRARYCQCTNDA